jgi:hypothetical protein
MRSVGEQLSQGAREHPRRPDPPRIRRASGVPSVVRPAFSALRAPSPPRPVSPGLRPTLPWLVRVFREVWGATVTLIERGVPLVGVDPTLNTFHD